MKEIIKTNNAPAALGPYSQAVKATGGTYLFCSGQIALDPATGDIVGKTAAEQCRQVMSNLQAVLKAGGGNFYNVIKTTIYLTDLNDFAAVNEVYGTYFDEDPPARATTEVPNLPKGALLEIDAVAVL